MNKEEEEINDIYEQLLDEYKDYKEEMTTVSKARKTFAMDVHEKMKQEQIEKILEELGDVVTKLNVTTKLNANDDLSKDKTKLHERFYDLLTEFKEINESSYGGSKKNGKTKRTVRKTKRTLRKKNGKKTNDKKTKRTVRKTKNKRKIAKKTT